MSKVVNHYVYGRQPVLARPVMDSHPGLRDDSRVPLPTVVGRPSGAHPSHVGVTDSDTTHYGSRLRAADIVHLAAKVPNGSRHTPHRVPYHGVAMPTTSGPARVECEGEGKE